MKPKLRVLKYELQIGHRFEVEVPEGAIPLHVGIQKELVSGKRPGDGKPHVWMLTKVNVAMAPMQFLSLPTGADLPESDPLPVSFSEESIRGAAFGGPVFIGTVQLESGEVFHYFHYPQMALPSADHSIPEGLNGPGGIING